VTVDRRVQRTRKALRGALLELMRERGYESVSIQDIVDRADVGRSTFYAHYADKEDLLRENVAALGAHLRTQMDPAAAPHPALAFARPMLAHVDAVRPMFVGLLGDKRSAVVHACFEDELAGLVREGLDDADGAPAAAVEAVVVAGFFALARWWVLEAPGLGVDAVHAIFVRLMAPALGTSVAD